MGKIQRYLDMVAEDAYKGLKDLKEDLGRRGESLEEHDAQYHDGHFDPKTMTCGKREEMAKGDDPKLDAGSEVSAGSEPISREAVTPAYWKPDMTDEEREAVRAYNRYLYRRRAARRTPEEQEEYMRSRRLLKYLYDHRNDESSEEILKKKAEARTELDRKNLEKAERVDKIREELERKKIEKAEKKARVRAELAALKEKERNDRQRRIVLTHLSSNDRDWESYVREAKKWPDFQEFMKANGFENLSKEEKRQLRKEVKLLREIVAQCPSEWHRQRYATKLNSADFDLKLGMKRIHWGSFGW